MFGLGWIATLFSGLGRWAQPDTWIALGAVAAVITVMTSLTVWHNDTKAQATAVATAQCDQKWVAKQIAQSTAVANAAAQSAQAAADAADVARLNAQGERDQAIARAIDLETQLSLQKANPIAWPRDIARSLRK